MFKFGDWINRKRHNLGYGIQSPSSFFFVTQVLKERRPYYAYAKLDNVIKKKRRYAHELFRITNYLHPTSCISVGSAWAACAMAAAKPSVKHYAIAPKGITAEQETLLREKGCCITDSMEQLTDIIDKTGTIGMFFISATDNIATVIKAVLPHTGKDSIIVVDGIRRNKETRKLWQQIVNDSATTVTYDMHRYGLLFFDKERIKQHYTLKR